MSHVSGGWLLEHLELSDQELGGICRYLEDERLITAGRQHWGHHTPFMILLTHAGGRHRMCAGVRWVASFRSPLVVSVGGGGGRAGLLAGR